MKTKEQKTIDDLVRTLWHIASACEKGIDQSDDELELFIANVREMSLKAIQKAEGN